MRSRKLIISSSPYEWGRRSRTARGDPMGQKIRGARQGCWKERLPAGQTIFQKGEDGYHEIFNHAGVGDEHYWEGPADRHVMSRYGMTASRKNGRRKDDDYDMELERKVQKNKRKNKRKKRNKLARGHANEYEMRMAYA